MPFNVGMSAQPTIEGVLHIYAPQPISRGIHTCVCPDCKQRTRMIWWSYEWLGAESTCLRCGREWIDGEWQSLPLTRRARQKNIASAKRRWRAMKKES